MGAMQAALERRRAGAGAGDQSFAPMEQPSGDPRRTAAEHVAAALGSPVTAEDVLALCPMHGKGGGPDDEGPSDMPSGMMGGM
jgi:hypothetical protein